MKQGKSGVMAAFDRASCKISGKLQKFFHVLSPLLEIRGSLSS
jgi:hypothetical protein